MSMTEALAGLREAVARLQPTAASADADPTLREDAGVIIRRLADVDRLAEPARAGPDPMAPDVRQARHDLMNALGAIDNHAELIVEDHDLDAVRAVRDGVRAVVEAVRLDL